MNARCEICLKKYGWAKPHGNILLVTINGKESLVCQRHNPLKEKQSNERKGV